jgi:coenzyme F420-0:L-glutamate ligase / coenzyme F420-1:gamma-L-glutamate ligase
MSSTSYDAFLALAKARRSVREFEDRPVPRELIDQLLEAARWAPSNHNRQPWRFLVLTDRTELRQLAQQVREALGARLSSLPPVAADFAGSLVHHATVFAQAPALIVAWHRKPVALAAEVLAGLPHPELVSGEPLSVAMAVQNLLLAAQSLGLGACVLTAPLLAGDSLTALLRAPAGFELSCFVAVGYARAWPEAPRRKNLEMIAEYWEHPCAQHDVGKGNL